MTIQVVTLSRIVEELQTLSLAQLQRISQPSKEEFILQIRRPQRTLLLAITLSPPDERLHLIEKKPPSLPHPTTFCMTLRKHLLNKRLESIEQIEEDRIVQIKWSNQHESFFLIAELLPRRANLILCDQNLDILQSHQSLPKTRGLRRGDRYTPPTRPDTNKMPQQTPRTTEQGNKEEFSFNFELAKTFAEKTRERRLEQYKQMALKARRNEHKKLRRLLTNLERDFKRCEQNLARSSDGELLKHNLHLLKRGMAEVEVTDYYSPTMEMRTIKLDPTASPQENLERIFRKIKRARKGLSAIQPRMEATEYRLLELEEEMENIARAKEEETLLQWLPEPSQQQKGTKKKQPTLPYREYTSSDGKRIWVGKNNRSNDELTFKFARGNDHWLHVRGIPGSHVLLPIKKGEQPSTEQLLDAATLAAHFSKARGESHVDVMHTQAKYVKKPKGTPPGQVAVLRDKNIALRLEKERLQRLLQNTQEKEEK